MLSITILLFLLPSSFAQHLVDEAIHTINGKRALHTVSDKFVSFSVDPAVLLAGLNLTDTTLRMARRLSPAYVRIAGPATSFVKYEAESWKEEETGAVAVTPTMWFGINEWLAAANLTPVFGINDRSATDEGWNPQEAMEVLDVADKFNVSCYWQLGYDCANKTEGRYESDLRRLQHILDAFPQRKEQWKIVGSDPTRCVKDPRKILDGLGDVLRAVVLEENSNIFLNDFLPRPKVPLWIAASKPSHHVSFASAISWAKETGEAAKNGYELVLRQPRLHEIYTETPIFWVSLLHKMLMGRKVLEIRTVPHPDLSVYAHCTKHQNDFIRSGAMTVLAVNNATTNRTILLKFGTALLKSTEVQSYILTGSDAMDVLLNGEKLSLDTFEDAVPKLRRARIVNYLSLFLPPRSVGFFVLPSAQIPVCANEEADLNQLMEEIQEDQKIPFSEEVSVEVAPRFSLHRTPTLREIKQRMEKELESDERYYKQMTATKKKIHDDVDGKNSFIQRMKHKQNENAKRLEESKREDVTRHRQHKEEPKRVFELELTSAEIRRVLADRAKVKAAKKNIIFTSEELEEIMEKATQKFLNNKNASIRIRKKTKREVTRDKKDINMRLLKLKSMGDRRKMVRESLKNRRERLLASKREKRDINMQLLKLKAEMQNNNKHRRTKKKEKFENYEEKQATIREPGQSSEEFMDFEEEEEVKEESPLPDKDVFAELADPEEYPFTTTTERSKGGLRMHRPKIEVQPIKYEEKTKFEDDFEINSGPDDGDRDVNFDCIHEFFGKSKTEAGGRKNSSELWEVGLEFEDGRRNNKLPSFANRIKEVGVDVGGDDKNLDLDLKDGKSGDFVDDDYEDLESEESRPLRLKRGVLDPAKVKIDDSLKNQQYKFLKERLVHKKKLDFINKNRESRSLVKNSFNERYESLTDGLKIWKPFDILTLKPKNAKTKRSVDHDMDSVENEIENFLKEVMKDSKLDKTGDYQLVFPNKDKVEVVEKSGDTELKLVLHGDAEATTKSNIQKISKKQNGNVWKQLYRKLSKFFQGLSAQLKKCIMEDLLSGS